MSLSSCFHCGPELAEYAIATVIFFFAPVGAFVFRRHIAEAVEPWKTAGRALQALALISTPFAVLLVLAVVLQMVI